MDEIQAVYAGCKFYALAGFDRIFFYNVIRGLNALNEAKFDSEAIGGKLWKKIHNFV